MKVHILASCLNEELIDATTLVFKTIRIGFPTAEIAVWGNGLKVGVERELLKRMEGVVYSPVAPITHDAWIEELIVSQNTPFWICDTDMVFHDKVEDWDFCWPLAGRFEQRFCEPWTRTHKVARLHTSLMKIAPKQVREEVRKYFRTWHPKDFIFLPSINLYHQSFVPNGVNQPPLFYDTLAGLYQAIGGQAFDGAQCKAYTHLHCGTYSDRMTKVLPGFRSAQEAAWRDLGLVKNLATSIDSFYERNKL